MDITPAPARAQRNETAPFSEPFIEAHAFIRASEITWIGGDILGGMQMVLAREMGAPEHYLWVELADLAPLVVPGLLAVLP